MENFGNQNCYLQSFEENFGYVKINGSVLFCFVIFFYIGINLMIFVMVNKGRKSNIGKCISLNKIRYLREMSFEFENVNQVIEILEL